MYMTNYFKLYYHLLRTITLALKLVNYIHQTAWILHLYMEITSSEGILFVLITNKLTQPVNVLLEKQTLVDISTFMTIYKSEVIKPNNINTYRYLSESK